MAVTFILFEGNVYTGICNDSLDYIKEAAKPFIADRRKIKIRSGPDHEHPSTGYTTESKNWHYDYGLNDWVEC